MSKITKNVPLLHLSLLGDLKFEVELAMGGHGWALTNRIEGEKFNLAINLFLYNYMAKHQLDVIIHRATNVYEMALAFSKGEFDKYLDDYNEYADMSTEPFDPYTEIKWQLTTNGISDLPEEISDFKELLIFVQTFTLRRKAMKNSFKTFFGGKIKHHYRCRDQDGNEVMVPADQLPENVLDDIETGLEVKEGLSAINIEHCLDNYNEWFSQVKSIVEDRADFKKILALFGESSMPAEPLQGPNLKCPF